MKQAKLALSALALGLALGAGQVAAQPTLSMDENMVKKMMPMMDKDKDGMISKAEAMEVFGRKFDAMSKGGKMTAKQFADFATAIGQGNLNP
jgi:hypothetical protein